MAFQGASTPHKQIVLLGIGHTNAHVLRMWQMKPLPGASLVCVSDFSRATYSGMLPGALAGQYAPDELEIDLVRLCAAAGARLICEPVTGLDVLGQRLLFESRPPLTYDALSIGVGSRPIAPPTSSSIVAIKPMQTFLTRLDLALARLHKTESTRPRQFTVVGAGAAGVELALCLPRHIESQLGSVDFSVRIVSDGDDILPGMPRGAISRARAALDQRGVALHLGRRVVQSEADGTLYLDDRSSLPSDLTLWAVSARPQPVTARLGLPTDEQGFIATLDTLQSTGSGAVFAVGDAGSCLSQPRPKAGVYAVRQAPVLWENLQCLLAGRQLTPWKAQGDFLSLLNTGDGRAILSYKGRSVRARWCWKLKDWIDRRFVAKYQKYERPKMARPMATADGHSNQQMWCTGCGCKVPSDTLRRVLSQVADLAGAAPDSVLSGLQQPDDVAVWQQTTGRPVAASVDFFTLPIDDPYVAGRLAALHALSDMDAKQCVSRAALALAAVPRGDATRQEEFLREALAGGVRELAAAGATLVGGHSIATAEPVIGFAIVGEGPAPELANDLAEHPSIGVGDRLVLTKPLGTGVLLAGHMRAACRATWMDALLESMLQSNAPASAALRGAGAKRVTDVTGFGLAGHLLQLLTDLEQGAELELEALPILPGALELSAAGIESTLAPSNRVAERSLHADAATRENARWPLLFDPQTAGGLLAVVSQAGWVALEHQTGLTGFWTVGRIVESHEGQTSSRVRIVG